MKVSVIIPVYNAEKYLEKAVESALSQEQTGEVILVEDCSPDNSIDICKKLSAENPKVKLYQHPDKKNHGAGSTRNLGIKKAECEYLAFLDADDYYLPGRFEKAKALFQAHDHIDGVYEPIGMHFYDEKSKESWLAGNGELMTTVNKEEIHPNRLFFCLVNGKNGYIHLDGLVVKRNLFDKCGYFPEHLRLHQDTALILKMSAMGRLFPGNLKTPIARRGIHSDNRITQNKRFIETQFLLWKTLKEWAIDKRIDINKIISIYRRYILSSYRYNKKKQGCRISLNDLFTIYFNELLNNPIIFVMSILYLLSYRLQYIPKQLR